MIRRLGGFVALALSIAACNSVLGIDEAKQDPALLGVGGSGGAGGGGGGTGGSSPATPCDAYCDAIMSNCTGTNQEYISRDVCMLMCAAFEPGVPGDTSNDSLECRKHYADLALAEPNTRCKQAGPLGTGACGTDPCRTFCALDSFVCSKQVPPPYPDAKFPGTFEQSCQAACATFKVIPNVGELVLTGGDSLNCRVYHLEAAAASASNPTAPETHCPHTIPVSAHCNDMM